MRACAGALRATPAQPRLVGAYLHGSSTTGDFVHGRSDIDLLLIVASELAVGELQALRRHLGGGDAPAAAFPWRPS